MKTTKQLKKHDIAFHTVTIAKEIVSTSRKKEKNLLSFKICFHRESKVSENLFR